MSRKTLAVIAAGAAVGLIVGFIVVTLLDASRGAKIVISDLTDADVSAALKALCGRSPSLKTHSLEGWPPRMGRVIWRR